MKRTKIFLSILLAIVLIMGTLPVMTVSAASVRITSQPKTSYTAYGSTAKATVKATGDGLKYTWYVKSSNSTKYKKALVTKSTYSVKMTDSSKNSKVYCVVKDRKGKTVKSSTATLRMKATITTQPKTAYAKKGATVKTAVKVKGDGLKYTWYYKNAGATKYAKSAIKSATYSTTMTDKIHGRYVYCVITDKYGKSAKSKTVRLYRSATIVTQPKSVEVANGKTAKVTLKAEGDGLKYTWYYKNTNATKYTKSALKTATYSVTMSDKINGRKVYCVVTDKYGKTDKSSVVSLKNTPKPLTITRQPNDTVAKENDQVGFGISVTGGKAPYKYKLQRTDYNGDEEVWTTVQNVEVLTMGNLTELVFTVSFEEDYYYRIEVTDAAGTKVVSEVVHVRQAVSSLEIEEQPQVVTATVGDFVAFSVLPTGGSGIYSYQWQYTHDNLDEWLDCETDWAYGSTSSTITFEVDAEDFALNFCYRCIITDSNGEEIVSDEVWVELDESKLSILNQPEIVIADVGETVFFSVDVVGGTGPYTYCWEYMSNSFEWTRISDIWATGAQTNTVSFVVGENEFSAGYYYRCIITDAEGNHVTTIAVFVLART